MEKNEVNKLIRQSIDSKIRRVLVDMLTYLSNKGFDVKKEIPRLNNADYLLLDNKNSNLPKIITYRYSYKEITEEISINRTNIGGFYRPLYVIDKKTNEIIFVKDLVVVISNLNEKFLVQKIIHELLHLISAVTIEKVNDEIYIHKTGVVNYKYKLKDGEMFTLYFKGESYLNEGMTEAIKEYLFNEIYYKKMKLKYKLEKTESKDKYISSYYLITHLIKTMDLGFEKENNIDVMLDIYLNNKTEKIYKKMMDMYGLSKKEVINIFLTYELLLEKYCFGQYSNEDIAAIFEDRIYPFYLNIIDASINKIRIKYYKNSNKEKMKEELELYKEKIIELFSCLIFNIAKRDVTRYINEKIKALV